MISESRDDFTADIDLREFHRLSFQQLIGLGHILEVHGPEACTIGSFAALQSEIVIAGNRWITKYLFTAIAGQRAFHQVIAWSAPSTYDRSQFQELLH